MKKNRFSPSSRMAALTKYKRRNYRGRHYSPLQETLNPDFIKLAAKSARDEYTDGAVYRMLSRHEKNPSFKKALENLAGGEQSHHEFWRAYAPEAPVKVNRLKVYFTWLLRVTLGLTFTMKFLERHEEAVHQRYREM